MKDASTITTPRKPAKSSKGAPPVSASSTPTSAAGNTSKRGSADLVAINFKVESEFHIELKMFAAMHKMTMVDVLKESFAQYKQSKGGA